MNGRERALARIQDAIFKYSGKKRENQGAMPVTFVIWCPGRHSNYLHGWYLKLGLCYSREIISLLSSMYFLAMGRESSRMWPMREPQAWALESGASGGSGLYGWITK